MCCRPQQTNTETRLGDANVGHQLLKKMGESFTCTENLSHTICMVTHSPVAIFAISGILNEPFAIFDILNEPFPISLIYPDRTLLVHNTVMHGSTQPLPNLMITFTSLPSKARNLPLLHFPLEILHTTAVYLNLMCIM